MAFYAAVPLACQNFQPMWGPVASPGAHLQVLCAGGPGGQYVTVKPQQQHVVFVAASSVAEVACSPGALAVPCAAPEADSLGSTAASTAISTGPPSDHWSDQELSGVEDQGAPADHAPVAQASTSSSRRRRQRRTALGPAQRANQEQRIDPQDGVLRTFREVAEKYRSGFSEASIASYWEERMVTPTNELATSAAAALDAAPVAADAGEAHDAIKSWLNAEGCSGFDNQAAVIKALQGRVLHLAFDASGCRIVQKALEVADRQVCLELVCELCGHVTRAIKSPWANYVVQKVIERLPPSLSSFVAEEIGDSCMAVARHSYGCRVLCRLLEHTASSESTAALVDKLLDGAQQLSRHSFGHHVMESVLEHGLPRQQARVVAAVCAEPLASACNRNASHVLAAALLRPAAEDQQALVAALTSSREEVIELARSQSGRFILKTLMRIRGAHVDAILTTIHLAAPALQANRYEKQLLKDLQRVASLDAEAA